MNGLPKMKPENMKHVVLTIKCEKCGTKEVPFTQGAVCDCGQKARVRGWRISLRFD